MGIDNIHNPSESILGSFLRLLADLQQDKNLRNYNSTFQSPESEKKSYILVDNGRNSPTGVEKNFRRLIKMYPLRSLYEYLSDLSQEAADSATKVPFLTNRFDSFSGDIRIYTKRTVVLPFASHVFLAESCTERNSMKIIFMSSYTLGAGNHQAQGAQSKTIHEAWKWDFKSRI